MEILTCATGISMGAIQTKISWPWKGKYSVTHRYEYWSCQTHRDKSTREVLLYVTFSVGRGKWSGDGREQYNTIDILHGTDPYTQQFIKWKILNHLHFTS